MTYTPSSEFPARPPEVMLTGLINWQDALTAASLGVRYFGLICDEGREYLPPKAAREITTALRENYPDRAAVAVTDSCEAQEVVDIARGIDVSAVALYSGKISIDAVRMIRQHMPDGQIMKAVEIPDMDIPWPDFIRFVPFIDVVAFDRKINGKLGGTGISVPFYNIADCISFLRQYYANENELGKRRAVRSSVAGGIEPGNVRDVVRTTQPDMLDVSSSLLFGNGRLNVGALRDLMDNLDNAYLPPYRLG